MNPLYEYELYKKEDYKASVGEWKDWAERIVTYLRTELKAADNDYKRYKLLKREAEQLEVDNEALRDGWQNLSDMMRNGYIYAEYCYWCKRTVFHGEGHTNDCEFDNALLEASK